MLDIQLGVAGSFDSCPLFLDHLCEQSGGNRRAFSSADGQVAQPSGRLHHVGVRAPLRRPPAFPHGALTELRGANGQTSATTEARGGGQAVMQRWDCGVIVVLCLECGLVAVILLLFGNWRS